MEIKITQRWNIKGINIKKYSSKPQRLDLQISIKKRIIAKRTLVTGI